MKNRLERLTPLLLSMAWGALLLFSTVAHAQTKDDLKISLKVEKVVIENGVTKLVGAEKTRPGDLIQYTATYVNQSKGTLRNLQPHLPIPIGMVYDPEGVAPVPAMASSDGTQFGNYPLKRSVGGSNGAAREESTPFAEYRALRWRVESLLPGQTLVIKARAKVASLGGSAAK